MFKIMGELISKNEIRKYQRLIKAKAKYRKNSW